MGAEPDVESIVVEIRSLSRVPFYGRVTSFFRSDLHHGPHDALLSQFPLRGPNATHAMIRRAVEIVRSEGVFALWMRMLGQVFYRRLLVLRTELSTGEFKADTRCRWLLVNEASRYAHFDTSLSTEVVQSRLRDGHRCFVLMDERGDIVHGMWVAFDRAFIDYLRQDLILGPREAYLYQSYTAPAHRGKRYATASARALKHQLAVDGFAATLACVQPDKAMAYPPVFRGGAVPTAYIGWVGIGPWRIAFRRSANRYPWYAPKMRGEREGSS